MVKKIFSALLCLVALFVLLPNTVANAAVLPGMTSKVDYDNTDPGKYTIDIDLVNQIITVYDNYTGATMVQGLCTTGDDENPTGAGVFKVGELKERFGYFVAYGQYAQYWTQVVRGIYIHSVMYDKKDTSTMSRSAYNNLGTRKSHGCVRVLPDVAQWIFYNCPPGTTCNVVRNRAANSALVSSIKSNMTSYSKYKQPTDAKAEPAIIPAAIRYNNVPLRTGFSASRDTTVVTLNANDKVLLLQLGAEWCKVKTANGDLGYVKSSYLLCYPDAASQSQSKYVSSKKTYVYAEMDVDSKRLITIPADTEVSVSESSGQYWYKGTYEGVTGYCRKKYVKCTTSYAYPDVGTVTTTNTVTGAVTTATGAYVKDGILAGFRAAPATNAALISTLPAGTAVAIVSIVDNWYYCQVNGIYGYIHKVCIATN